MISKKPICPRHPGVMGSHQTAGSVPAPRVKVPSHGSHVTALIAFLAVTGREYHCPHCWSSPCWELPSSHRVCFSLRVERESKNRPKSNQFEISLLSLTTHPGAVSKLAYAHHNNNGNVLDEWVWGFQGTDPSAKKRTGEGE